MGKVKKGYRNNMEKIIEEYQSPMGKVKKEEKNETENNNSINPLWER